MLTSITAKISTSVQAEMTMNVLKFARTQKAHTIAFADLASIQTIRAILVS